MAVPEEKDFYISSAPQMAAANLDIADLKIVDDRFPGVTFTGTAKSIYEEMQALKPEAFADDVDIVKARSLEKRSTVSPQYLDLLVLVALAKMTD
ncbi:hypothetical protein BKA66DRAFT_473179 [Pyrenochaeta sp. MPI-SDFR-AT-0127]|nr:hypothetical protein BKA66DRAFT_473179 [Pyrenochaeta sp. MPI-SDFR-AT-0127]